LIDHSQSILFSYNVQHDCNFAKCIASGKRAVVQERVQSDKTEVYVEHKEIGHYLLNTHAFHNAHLIRAVLPRHLTAPIPYVQDRHAHHDQIATALRVSQDAKRVATARKASEKRTANPNPQKSKKRKRAGKDQEHDEGAMGIDRDVDIDDLAGDKVGDDKMSDMQ